MPTEETTPLPEKPKPPELRFSYLIRALFLYTGVILPIICFAIGYPDRPVWQSGSLQAYCQLFLSREATLPLYPVLLYNMTCMALLIFAPGRFINKAWVRFGVYSGVPVALVYWAAFGFANFGVHSSGIEVLIKWLILSMFAVFIPWLFFYFVNWLDKKYNGNSALLNLLIAIVFMSQVAIILLSFVLSLILSHARSRGVLCGDVGLDRSPPQGKQVPIYVSSTDGGGNVVRMLLLGVQSFLYDSAR